MFFSHAEELLLQSLTSKWQRRGTSLLHIGLQSYTTPEFFWDAGFDVSAVDEDSESVDFYKNYSESCIKYTMAKGEHLPFDDDSFDYAFFSSYMSNKASLHHSLAASRNAEGSTTHEAEQRLEWSKEQIDAFMLKDFFAINSVFTEACRVAQRGVVFVCKNAWTLGHFEGYGKKKNPYSIWKNAKRACPVGQVRVASSLIYPQIIQKRLPDIECMILPLGALLGVCMDFNAPPATGLGLRVTKEKVKAYSEAPAVNRVLIKK